VPRCWLLLCSPPASLHAADSLLSPHFKITLWNLSFSDLLTYEVGHEWNASSGCFRSTVLYDMSSLGSPKMAQCSDCTTLRLVQGGPAQ
jgi:hypothetical protein